MFFTRAAFVMACLAFFPSVVAYAIIFCGQVTGNEDWLVQTFGVPFSRSDGEFLKGIAIGVAFGVAAEISRSVAARR